MVNHFESPLNCKRINVHQKGSQTLMQKVQTKWTVLNICLIFNVPRVPSQRLSRGGVLVLIFNG